MAISAADEFWENEAAAMPAKRPRIVRFMMGLSGEKRALSMNAPARVIQQICAFPIEISMHVAPLQLLISTYPPLVRSGVVSGHV
jgi:hypothetical protein